jgi:hypothetical protein
MTVQELREKLDLIDGECEVLIVDERYSATYEIENAMLEPYYDNEVDNGKSPFCIQITT